MLLKLFQSLKIGPGNYTLLININILQIILRHIELYKCWMINNKLQYRNMCTETAHYIVKVQIYSHNLQYDIFMTGTFH